MSASKYAKPLQQMCVCVHVRACTQMQDILQGQLDWKTLCFKCLSMITEFQELFETPMHVVIISPNSINKLLSVTEMQCFHDI